MGGKLSKRKGVSLPDTLLPFSAMTDKDRADLEFAIGVGVDWIALSFVQRVSDVVEARQLTNGKASIMAKIEKPSAISDLDAIIEESDGLMIARGDLGVDVDAIGASSRPAKTYSAFRAPGWQTSCGGHPDARKHDRSACANQSRSV